ncbi:MAG: 2-phosphosulfolactate phosphatase [Planctomycetota bacterium]|nr:2-phosphosulfolactate phosphatase [Planctomycetota bacterium]
MTHDAQVLFLPTLVPPDDFADKVVVVIDVLRATTTITHALASGATEIIPFRDVEAARDFAKQDDSVLLCGERNERRVDGFDLGNSPRDYTSEVVAGRRIAFTTTNGTAALHHCRAARNIILAAFVNLSAVTEVLLRIEQQDDVVIVCAGTCGEITLEDMLLAGAVVDGGIARSHKNDQAQFSELLWKSMDWDQARLERWLRRSQGGRNLITSGFEDDIAFAAMLDRFHIVPEFHPATGRITSRSGC